MSDTFHTNKNANLLLFGASISIVLAGFTALSVSTAMPDIARVLNGIHLYPVAFGIPIVGQLIATPIAGAITDSRGAKKPLILGFLLFVSGLLLCGFAPGINTFILGRALQGFGGGFLMVPVYALVGLLVTPSRRPLFFASFALAWVLPAIFGPVLAGKIVEAGHWRWIFLGMTPLVILASTIIIPLLFKLPTYNKQVPERTRSIMFMATGTGLSIGLIMLVGTLPRHLYALKTIGTLIGIAIAVYCAPRLFPSGTFKLKKGIPSVVACRGVSNGLFVALESFIPLVLQSGRGYLPSNSGILLTIGTLAYALGSVVQGKIIRPDLARKVPQVGAYLALVGAILTSTIAFVQLPVFISVIGWTVTGFAVGLIYPSMSVLVLSWTPQAQHGEASSSLQIADTIGSATAIATVTALFSIVFVFPPPWPYVPVVSIGIILAILTFVSSKRLYVNDDINYEVKDFKF
ncbi:MFS transporter [Actinomyces sp. zg-332]|uniref:MFS transporter n=1 Tax=Actinomyces sp. zg-332 TaxID=2708340 RepID=UPI00141D9109|nr:MFS transporter [Actinomyces sp. zg-332]QPK93632.1 MFS transporter [Actinomyces sp. zg-332]